MSSIIKTIIIIVVISNGILFGESEKNIPITNQKLILEHGEIIHARSQSVNNNPLKIILLSGPTDFWHADSAWFARLQPVLSKNGWQNIAIDRPGFLSREKSASKPATPRGYGSLALLLDEIIQKTIPDSQSSKLIIIAYASSNLSIWPWLSDMKYKDIIRGIILIDPDVLLPHSIAQYKSDASPFKENYQKYLQYVFDGNYQERTNQITDAEREHLRKILPENSDMDWSYYDSIEKWRRSISGQLHKFDEVASYADDLDRAFKAGDPSDIPLYIIDTDFEERFIENSKDKPDVMKGLIKWQQEGTRWFKQLAESSSGQYYPLTDADHLVMMQKPETVISIINNILYDKLI